MDARPGDLQPAPFFADIAKGPEGGQAHWVKTSDGLRIRVGHWQPETATKGTVLLFPGRTEYIEKYGPAAAELANRGYATLTIDWRGQGLADRMLPDRRLGHIDDFQDFQKDIAAALDLGDRLALPKPYFLIGHSMGGAIGLRALIEGLPVKACVFTGPMWGIDIAPAMRLLSRLMGKIGPAIGLGGKLVPTLELQTYVLANPFDGNTLTNDPAMYQLMRDQLQAQPGLALGGPTIGWLGQGLQDCAALAALDSPALPCITFLGKQEQIVDCPAIHDRMARWPGGELVLLDNVQHEVMMEAAEVRSRVFDRICSLFDQYR
ncbi:alpha/beta hydrolase [Parasedimentitalea psychrophila]|uniref:Alpha/beta hydrolase n=1 Tax=Parasedimentitalea psychrophila TaxID=2997337 RepID=A0A9Y2KVV8_9RHOB|nr:alpha/beta hydrolase [Parasedimentitalea psychrophila]WIY24110.1 alpha/beta hydrolase [Parasedimentitalea psychrophila]